MSLTYAHVDVFAPAAYAGNSLPVFVDAAGLDAAQMLAITRELRHFEAIFLTATETARTYVARVFDLFEELPFAGHPVIGAAAALHRIDGAADPLEWVFRLPDREVSVATHRTDRGFAALLDQGEASFLGAADNRDEIARAFSLTADDLDPRLPIAVVSTGLRYLIVPLKHGALERARVASDLTDLVTAAGAQFAVLLDEAALEIRHWNNDGVIEDVATGSAAGTIGAYRLRHCGARSGAPFTLSQGRFAGRPSRLDVEPRGTPDAVHSVSVGGHVSIVGHGVLEVLP